MSLAYGIGGRRLPYVPRLRQRQPRIAFEEHNTWTYHLVYSNICHHCLNLYKRIGALSSSNYVYSSSRQQVPAIRGFDETRNYQ
jgi:hypothetical protein